MDTISLTRTIDLHAKLARAYRHDPVGLEQSLARATASAGSNAPIFEHSRAMNLDPTALLLSRTDYEKLRVLACRLHDLVERALDWVQQEPARLDRYFADHARLFPYLSRPKGFDTWQALGRYDLAVTPRGELKIMELNTGCPAGMFHAPYFSSGVACLLEELGLLPDGRISSGAIETDTLVDMMLDAEHRAGQAPGLVAVLNDENGLMNELPPLVKALQSRDREAVIASADQLTWQDDGLCLDGRSVSLTFNKLRVSTVGSPGWCWRDDFENRYHALLQAMREQTCVSINAMTALSIAEDKGLLALLSSDEFRRELQPEDDAFLDRHLLPTARLEQGKTTWNGKPIDMATLLETQREQLVIKPANEGRGFEVTIGRFADSDRWNEACRPRGDLPKVVQQYAPLAELPVHGQPYYLTLGLFMLGGKMQGILSRVAPSPITNVSLGGAVQGVLIVDD